ncbi:exopolysaccharide biosynthesis protein [Rhizobium halophilum]|uniref:exopolysaccharide biosynthesis protein n=1 Tax=Rhizobium halophilum TaxID=2846852 RepID=UPI001EFD34A8|nr:exopolysaccharide biosynthesis protein [Rhizobium halophilum]MCF6371285.1 exopolysaccharide biosynthesis protein [Rhizobium halophilum]
MRALTDLLDHLEHSLEGDDVAISELVGETGPQSFAALMLLFALISTSPASAIPGVTAVVAGIEFLLVIQMIGGRHSLWLPKFISRRRLSRDKLCKGIQWLRKPVRFVEGFLKERLVALVTPPVMCVPLSLILILTLFMPFMEVIPTSGSIASAIIACVAAGFLTRDGLLVAISAPLLATVPAVAWYFGFAGQ